MGEAEMVPEIKSSRASADSSHASVRTLDEPSASRRTRHRAEPALVAVFADGRAVVQPLPLQAGELELGRTAHGDLPEDPLASRRHAQVRLGAGGWTITDLGSRNGTFVNGQRLDGGPLTIARGQRLVLRVGQRLYLGVEDAAPYRRHGVAHRDGAIIGPRLAEALEQVREAGRQADSLLVVGESGAGKELAARTFHTGGPFVPVNCGAIPEGVAERLLFGSTRGAFSGATDAVGYIQAAGGGTLFLDEVGELAPAVQAKLLRVLESREVVPLGAARPQPVSARFCFATLRNLRHLVAEERFRADLYYRVARTTVALPPLRERLEEIPWLIVRELDALTPALPAHVSFVEACLLGDWAGNVRELLSSVRAAASAARRAGGSTVRGEHLPAQAIAEVARTGAAETNRKEISAEQLRAALAAQRGNLAAAARALGINRSHFYRLLDRHGIDR